MKRVLVTRPAEQASALTRRLAEHDVATTVVPTVAIVPSDTGDELAGALRRHLGAGTDWLVLTSANGARALAGCLRQHDLTLPAGLRVAAVGPATAEVLREAGIGVDHVPGEFLTVAIAEGLGDLAGRRVVLARADIASGDLIVALRQRGAVVTEVVAYRTVEGPAASRRPLLRALAGGLDGVTFTSGSTVRGLIALLGRRQTGRATSLPAFCIGPVTADVARQAGFEPAVVAADHTAAGLADAIGDYFA